MTQPIRGKVAQVLNNREIAINLGTAKGVTIGMYFDVVDANGQNIKDPDTGEVLGSIERSKVRVKITRVQEKLSVATTYLSEEVNVGGTGPVITLGPFARALMPPEWVTKYETLNNTDKTHDDLEKSDSAVQTGDPVVQVLKVDEPEQEDTNEK